MSLRISIGSFIVIALLASSSQSQQDSPVASTPTLEQILKVWKSRQDKLLSARFELKIDKTIHKGSISKRVGDFRGLSAEEIEANPDPPQDYLDHGVGKYALSDGKVRFWSSRQQWSPEKKSLYPEQSLQTFNGQNYKSLATPGSSRQDYAVGIIRKPKESGAGRHYGHLPLTATYRGVHPQFPKVVEAYAPTGRTVAISNRPCLELANALHNGNRRELYYLDRERDYVIVRNVLLVDSLPNWQLDVVYAPDSIVGWVPKSWEYMIRHSKSGPILESARYTLTSYEINPSIDEREFDIEFPPGTAVVDLSGKREVEYVVKETGEKGRVVPSSTGLTYEDLKKPASTLPDGRLLTAIWSFAIICLLGTLIWYRHRKTKTVK